MIDKSLPLIDVQRVGNDNTSDGKITIRALKGKSKSKQGNKIKPTARQVLALKHMVENGSSKSEALTKAGYSPAIATQPHKVIESKGFQQLLEDSGLTDSFLLDSLKTDIENKAGNRLGELTLGFKLKGRLTDKVEHSGTVNLSLSALFEATKEEPKAEIAKVTDITD